MHHADAAQRRHHVSRRGRLVRKEKNRVCVLGRKNKKAVFYPPATFNTDGDTLKRTRGEQVTDATMSKLLAHQWSWE